MLDFWLNVAVVQFLTVVAVVQFLTVVAVVQFLTVVAVVQFLTVVAVVQFLTWPDGSCVTPNPEDTKPGRHQKKSERCLPTPHGH
jgi:hypothetical protein